LAGDEPQINQPSNQAGGKPLAVGCIKTCPAHKE